MAANLLADQIMYMSLPISFSEKGETEKSFEEVRIDDYLASYQKTGRYPQPVPEEPTDETQRQAAGLPALFKPFSERALMEKEREAEKITSLEKLPDAQVYTKLMYEGNEYMENIASVPKFSFFSPEELHYYAWTKGTHKTAPPGVTPIPFEAVPLTLPRSPLRGSTTLSASLNTTTQNPAIPAGEEFLSITCHAPFTGHSFEELRVAYMLAGREVSSPEIFAAAATSTTTPPASAPSSAPITPIANLKLYSPPGPITPISIPSFK